MDNLKKIMLVDDDKSITSFLKSKLEKTGKFTVVFTNDGSNALSLARKEKPDFIISDIDMPDVSGGDVGRELADSEDTKTIPLLFLSSLVSKDDEGIIGGRPMMSKSCKINELVEKIESMLNL
ncbi:MAG: response regulator [Desulfobacterales bacterium]|nr:response regulator [Desulfobacterales bacterium]